MGSVRFPGFASNMAMKASSLLCCFLFLTGVQVLLAQTERTSITGAVTDSTKAAVADAVVSIRNIATNIVNRATTNSAGLYFLTSLPPGSYELTVEKTGFRSAKVGNIPLTTGLAATQDVSLEIGAVQQAVEVSATAVQLEAQSSDMNSVVTSRAVAELPILSRDPWHSQRWFRELFLHRDSSRIQASSDGSRHLRSGAGWPNKMVC